MKALDEWERKISAAASEPLNPCWQVTRQRQVGARWRCLTVPYIAIWVARCTLCVCVRLCLESWPLLPRSWLTRLSSYGTENINLRSCISVWWVLAYRALPGCTANPSISMYTLRTSSRSTHTIYRHSWLGRYLHNNSNHVCSCVMHH